MSRRRKNRINLYIDDTEKSLVDKCCEASGLTMSEVTRVLIRRYSTDFIKDYSGEISEAA